MATITGLTAARMLAIEGASVVDGEVLGGALILTKFDGTTINAGAVVGPQGAQGDPGAPGVAGVSSIPGEIKAWPGLTLPVQATYGKWVWADGGVYSATTYPIAAGHINSAWKTAYGQSDPGAGNFRVPDFRGLVLAGLDAMPGGSRANRMTRSVAITIAAKTGEETHVITIAEMPSHDHADQHTNIFRMGRYGSDVNSFVTNTGSGADQHLEEVNDMVAPTGGGGAHENVQPTVFVPYIVRLDG